MIDIAKKLHIIDDGCPSLNSYPTPEDIKIITESQDSDEDEDESDEDSEFEELEDEVVEVKQELQDLGSATQRVVENPEDEEDIGNVKVGQKR